MAINGSHHALVDGSTLAATLERLGASRALSAPRPRLDPVDVPCHHLSMFATSRGQRVGVRRWVVGHCLLAVWILGAVALAAMTQALDRRTIEATVVAIAAQVDREYFDAGVGARAAAGLRRRLTDGRYKGPFLASALADVLTKDLQTETNDKHLVVMASAPPGAASPNRSTNDDRATTVRRTRAGIELAAIDADGIGVLRINFFFRPDEAREYLAEAMRTLAPARALILDFRGNGGGSPETAALIMSYLIDEPGSRLFEIVPRQGPITQYQTAVVPDGLANGRRPVFVLTSSKTFSAGEGVPFLLQQLKRAVVIGEPTPGAANPGRPYPIETGFVVTIPNGQVRSAIDGTNWEGRGVTPNVATAASAALDAARESARSALKGG